MTSTVAILLVTSCVGIARTNALVFHRTTTRLLAHLTGLLAGW
jgi:hypothetical protein